MRDLGTYYVRVEFDGGEGFIHQHNTCGRYTHGRYSCSPLDAHRIGPIYDDEDDLAHNIVYMFREGNYSCDCNLTNFIEDAHQDPRTEDPTCGDTWLDLMQRLTLVRPDATERVIWEAPLDNHTSSES